MVRIASQDGATEAADYCAWTKVNKAICSAKPQSKCYFIILQRVRIYNHAFYILCDPHQERNPGYTGKCSLMNQWTA